MVNPSLDWLDEQYRTINPEHLKQALVLYWHNVPADKDIPFIALSNIGQRMVKATAVRIQLEEERRNLKQLLNYAPVTGR